MVLNKDQEKQIKANLEKIKDMGSLDLQAFAQKWHMAKEDLDPSVFTWVLKDIDIKQAELAKTENFSAEVVQSEPSGEF